MEFAEEGGEAATPYEVLLSAAMSATPATSPARTASRSAGASSSRCLKHPPKAIVYPQGSWGPPEADELIRGYGGWHGPGCRAEASG